MIRIAPTMNFDSTGRHSHKIPFWSGYPPGKPGMAARFRLFLRQFSGMVSLERAIFCISFDLFAYFAGFAILRTSPHG